MKAKQIIQVAAWSFQNDWTKFIVMYSSFSKRRFKDFKLYYKKIPFVKVSPLFHFNSNNYSVFIKVHFCLQIITLSICDYILTNN
jgi:hypothetical protein